MPVKRRIPKARNEDVSEVAWALLTDAPVPDTPAAKWEAIFFEMPSDDRRLEWLGRPTLYALWERHREEVMADWVLDHPGQRPSLWWRYTAPRLQAGELLGRAADCAVGDLPSPRLRLGGIGTPSYEVLNFAPSLPFGIPDWWVTGFDAAYYNGRARDVNGNLMIYRRHDGQAAKDGDFEGVPPDPRDPPRYESQAAYLDRHGLFLPGERRRLTAADFEPETIGLDGE